MSTRQMRRNAGLVLFAAGFSHIAQLWIYSIDGHVLWAVSMGVCYVMIGLGLIGQSRTSLWLGSILPTLGAAGAAWRYLQIDSDPIILLHLAVDVVVAAICIYLLDDAYGWREKLKNGGSK